MPDIRRNILEELGPAPRIAILRGGGIGDYISITPALRALRTSLPRARITLITTPSLVDLARRYRSIDEVVATPCYHGVREGPINKAELHRFFAEMQKKQFDLALQWHGGGANSNPFVSQLGAVVTAGFRGEDAPELDFWLPYDHHQHEIMRYLDLVTLLGGRADGYQTDLPLQAEDFAELRSIANIVDLEALRNGRYLGMHVSSGARSRRWPAERFAAVANALLAEYDFAGVLLTAGPAQDADAATVLEKIDRRHQAVNLAGHTSLGLLGVVISQLPLLISNDSGPAHMAIALGTPTVVIFGSGNPQNWAPLQRTWHRPVADMSTPCRWMIHDGCHDTASAPCLQSVTIGRVLGEACALLDRMRMLAPAKADVDVAAPVEVSGLARGPRSRAA